MRQVHDPYGGVNPLVDKMLGNAYDIVKYVARYLKEIRYVAENMENVYNVAHGYRKVVAVYAEGSSTLSIPLPVGVNQDNLEGVQVMALDSSENYFSGPDTFNYGIQGNDLVISISSFLQYAQFKCVFNYTPSE